MKSIGEKIRDRRIEMELTQTELAEKVEVSLRTISKYEKDVVKPHALNLRKLCTVLGVSEAYLTNPDIEDVTYGLDEAPYVDGVRATYGRKAGMDMQQLLDGVQAMFAGGNTPQEDKDLFFQAVMQAYMETKQDAKQRFTPRKLRTDKE